MASQNVKGLNIKLSVDTTAINSALSDVNKSLTNTEKELKSVDKLLKFDPKNTTLLAQKQSLLSDAINNTKNKLEQLQKVKELADKDTGVDKNSKGYRDLQRQIEQAKQKLQDFGKESNNVQNALSNSSKGASNFKSTLEALVSSNLITAGLQAIGNLVSGIVNGIKNLFGGMLDLVKQGVSYNIQMETFHASIRAMLEGDEQATQKLIKNMKSLSSVSGFASSTLLEGARNLLSADISAENAEKTIEGLAKAIAYVGGSNDDLSRMITNLQGIASTGKATSQDLKQFKNIGINASKLVADATGKTVKQVEELGITYDMLSDAFIRASEEGGKFARTFEVQAGTFQGQLNAISSNWETLLGDISQDTSTALSTKILPSVNELLSSMTNAFEEDGMEGVKEAFSKGFENVITTLSDEGTIEQLFSGIENIMDIIGTAFDPDTEQGKKNLDALESVLEKMLDAITNFLTNEKIMKKFVEAGIEIAKAFVGAFIDYINENLTLYDGYSSYAEMAMARRHAQKNGGSGGFEVLQSGGFDKLASGGYNKINLNATFNVSGQLDESKAMMLADIMSDRINENLGNQMR